MEIMDCFLLLMYVIVEVENNETWCCFLYVLYGSIKYGKH
jgi:hypothetical protein